MHLDDESAQRLLHRELTGSDEARTRAHLAECPSCTVRFDQLAREEALILARLRLLDHPAAPVSAHAVLARAAARPFEWRRWAALLVLAVGLAGAAYAVPGSAIREWIEAVVNPREPTPVAPPQSPGFGGLAVAPGARLVIEFATADSGSRVVVRLVGGSEVAVRAPTGAANYTADGGRLVVDNGPGPVEFRIDIPATAPRVEIRIGSKLVFLKEAGRSGAAGPLEGTGPFVISLGGN